MQPRLSSGQEEGEAVTDPNSAVAAEVRLETVAEEVSFIEDSPEETEHQQPLEGLSSAATAKNQAT